MLRELFEIDWHAAPLRYFVGCRIPATDGVAARTTTNPLLGVFPFGFRVLQIDCLGQVLVAASQMRLNHSDQDIFELDFEIFDPRPVSIGPKELQPGFRDRLAHRAMLSKNGGGKVGQLGERDV